jgi:hypothetical protein
MLLDMRTGRHGNLPTTVVLELTTQYTVMPRGPLCGMCVFQGKNSGRVLPKWVLNYHISYQTRCEASRIHMFPRMRSPALDGSSRTNEGIICKAKHKRKNHLQGQTQTPEHAPRRHGFRPLPGPLHCVSHKVPSLLLGERCSGGREKSSNGEPVPGCGAET